MFGTLHSGGGYSVINLEKQTSEIGHYAEVIKVVKDIILNGRKYSTKSRSDLKIVTKSPNQKSQFQLVRSVPIQLR